MAEKLLRNDFNLDIDRPPAEDDDRELSSSDFEWWCVDDEWCTLFSPPNLLLVETPMVGLLLPLFPPVLLLLWWWWCEDDRESSEGALLRDRSLPLLLLRFESGALLDDRRIDPRIDLDRLRVVVLRETDSSLLLLPRVEDDSRWLLLLLDSSARAVRSLLAADLLDEFDMCELRDEVDNKLWWLWCESTESDRLMGESLWLLEWCRLRPRRV